jgi:hypothetical protein
VLRTLSILAVVTAGCVALIWFWNGETKKMWGFWD